MKELTGSESWFDYYVVDDRKEILEISIASAKRLEELFKIKMGDTPETVICVYAQIFHAICEVVNKQFAVPKDGEWLNFSIEIANHLAVGFTNKIDDAEKTGNIFFFIRDINRHTQETLASDKEEKLGSIDLLTQWNAINVRKQADLIKEISDIARTNIKNEIDITISSNEFIIPTFCTIHTFIVAKAKELSAIRTEPLNISGLYHVQTYYNDETDDMEIYYETGIYCKLGRKSDAGSSGDN